MHLALALALAEERLIFFVYLYLLSSTFLFAIVPGDHKILKIIWLLTLVYKYRYGYLHMYMVRG
jgi:hypothetical protein